MNISYKEFKKMPLGKKLAEKLDINSEADYIAWVYETLAIWNDGDEQAADCVASLSNQLEEEVTVEDIEEIIFG